MSVGIYKICFPLILLSACLYSCLGSGNIHEDRAESIKVNIPAKLQSVADSVLFSLSEVVFLEGKEESFVGSIKKMQLTPEGIYVHDADENKLVLFGRDGKYISKVAAIGRGPSEYITLDDFYVDRKNEEVITYHTIPCKIMVYDLNLNFKEVILLPEELYCSGFVVSGDSLIWRTFAS